MLLIITPKVGLQKNITAVGKVTLHVWSSNWGAAAAEALNKWDGGRARRGEVGLPPPQFWGPGVLPPGNL